MNVFGWQGAPSTIGASQKPETASPLSAADRLHAVLRQHSVGGLTQDEIKVRVAAQLAAIKANRTLAKVVA